MKKYLIFLALSLFVLGGCHEGVFHWITPEAVSPTPEVGPEVLPEEEVGVTEPDPVPEPPCLLIKGNISSSGEKIYHMPEGANYNQVKIDEAKGEAFFCTEEEAVSAGWRKATR